MSSLGDKLKSFGGYLECSGCGNRKHLGDIGHKLSNGWPKCCGYTMRRLTQNELNQRELITLDPMEDVIDGTE